MVMLPRKIWCFLYIAKVGHLPAKLRIGFPHKPYVWFSVWHTWGPSSITAVSHTWLHGVYGSESPIWPRFGVDFFPSVEESFGRLLFSVTSIWVTAINPDVFYTTSFGGCSWIFWARVFHAARPTDSVLELGGSSITADHNISITISHDISRHLPRRLRVPKVLCRRIGA